MKAPLETIRDGLRADLTAVERALFLMNGQSTLTFNITSQATFAPPPAEVRKARKAAMSAATVRARRKVQIKGVDGEVAAVATHAPRKSHRPAAGSISGQVLAAIDKVTDPFTCVEVAKAAGMPTRQVGNCLMRLKADGKVVKTYGHKWARAKAAEPSGLEKKYAEFRAANPPKGAAALQEQNQ